MPREHWPQHDIPAGTVAGTGTARILVAARASPFKTALVERLAQGLRTDCARLDLTGIEALAGVDPVDYDAVVIVCTTLAWGLDEQVTAFLDRTPHPERVVLALTADSDWRPPAEGRRWDVVTGASRPTEVNRRAWEVMERVGRILRPVPTPAP